VEQVKSLLRKAEARTHDQLLLAIAPLYRAVTPRCLGWFVACAITLFEMLYPGQRLPGGAAPQAPRCAVAQSR